MLLQRLLGLTTLLLSFQHGWCVCYFPGELQGVWATQRTTTFNQGSYRASRSPISYQEVTIEADLILQWGVCHARAENNVILMDSTGGTKCYRCLYLNVASPKVMQVWTMGLETCYTSEEAALSTCPSSQAMASRRAREIMLYKLRSNWGDPEIREVECPLNGKYSFTYKRGHNAQCEQPTSEFSNCPYGFGFSVTYRECSFVTPLLTSLQCLGSWVGEDGEDYLAVLDTSVQPGEDAPQYKCGMFHEEAGTGRVFLAFSEDSTCTNNLVSPTDGYETYEMTSIPALPLPPAVGRAKCTFPRNLMGHWHHTYVSEDTIVFKDYKNFKTYSARCVHDLNDNERYIVYARTHCGDWTYNCLWLKRRSANILEFMQGLYPMETFDDRLCDVGNFGDMTSWTTQGKSLLEEPTTCPIIGNYAGELPDAIGFCAQLYSDCKDPQIMYFTVSDCINNSAVYEREDLPGPTSEAGPWLPPEQKVSTGAMLTIVEDSGGRGRRQASKGRLRVANARTTTISWLWGSSTSDTTTSTTTTTPTTTTTTTVETSTPDQPIWRRPPLSEPPGIGFPSSDRDYERRINPNPFLEDPRPPPQVPRPAPPRRDEYDAVGFWPNIRNEPEYSVGRESPVPPPPKIVPGIIEETDSSKGGVPGRATWVPGAPPGFHSPSSSTLRPFSSEGNYPFPQTPQAQTSTSSNSDGRPYLPAASTNRQPVRQGMNERVDIFAWDNRHKYPKGYWHTTEPQRTEGSQRNHDTKLNTQSDNTDNGMDRENIRDTKYSMTDSQVHESAREQDSLSWASWPGSDSSRKSNSFPSGSALSGFDDPVDVNTTTSSSAWKPSLGPVYHTSSPSLNSHPSPDFTLNDRYDSTNHRQPGTGSTDSDNYDQVRDNNSSRSSGRIPSVQREPGGRGFWASQSDSNNNHDNKHTDIHSSNAQSAFSRDSVGTVNRPADRLGDTLSLQPGESSLSNNGHAYIATISSLDTNLISSHIENRQGYKPLRHGTDVAPTGDVRGTRKLGNDPGIVKPVHEPGSSSVGGFTSPQRKGLQQTYSKEREYQCLGQWEEEGRVYALTFRRDIRTYECFVGVIRSSGLVFIKEAGNVCSRGVKPEVLGMKLHRKGDSCPQPQTTSRPSKSSQREESRPQTAQPPWLRTTRPWKPITGRPRHRGSGSRGLSTTSQPLLIMFLMSFYMFVNFV